MRVPKRETDGRYAFDGNLNRVCVCGHTLGVHASGSPADCLLYSFPSDGAIGENLEPLVHRSEFVVPRPGVGVARKADPPGDVKKKYI